MYGFYIGIQIIEFTAIFQLCHQVVRGVSVVFYVSAKDVVFIVDRENNTSEAKNKTKIHSNPSTTMK